MSEGWNSKDLEHLLTMAGAKATIEKTPITVADLPASKVKAVARAIVNCARWKPGKKYVGPEHFGDVLVACSLALGAGKPKKGRPTKRAPGRPKEDAKKMLTFYLAIIFERATGEALPEREASRFGTFVREVGKAIGFGNMNGQIRDILKNGPTKLLGLKSPDEIPRFADSMCVKISDEIELERNNAEIESSKREKKSRCGSNIVLREKPFKIERNKK